jgi:phytoene synthase
VTGADLAKLEDGYAALLDERPDADRVGDGGAALFRCGARLLDARDEKLKEAGRIYGLAQAMRRGMMALADGTNLEALTGHRFGRSIRPLTCLARLAARDIRQAPAIEPEATPGRAVALLSHKLFGTVA